MRKILIALSILFIQITGSLAQDSLIRSKWSYLNRYELSVYAISVRDFRDYLNPSWGGNELNIDLLSYKTGRNEFSVSSGMFFIDKRPEMKSDPHIQYFYFPLNLNYQIYSKNFRNYGRLSIGTPLYLNEDSKYTDGIGKFWMGYDDLAQENRPFYSRKRMLAIGQLRYGYCLNEHFSLNIGAIAYVYSSNYEKASTLIQLAAGIAYKL